MNPHSHPNLDSFVDNELPLDAQNEVRAHLATCADCSRELERIRLLKERTREAAAQLNPPEDLTSKIRAGIQQYERNQIVARRRYWMVAAAAAAALVFVVWRASTWGSPDRQLASLLRIGVTDHVECAVPRTYSEPPPSRTRMEQDMGPQFKDLIDVMREEIPWDYRLEQAHRCTAGLGRKYVHLIFRNAPALVSVTMSRKTPNESFASKRIKPALSSWSGNLYQTKVGQYEAAGGETDEYLWFVVSNLQPMENEEMAKRISVPLTDYLRNHMDRVALAPW